MDMLYEALRCASVGLRVIPLYEVTDDLACTCWRREQCKQPGKHPRVDVWQEKATTDEATIREWWTQWPRAGLGMATGRASGVWVLDLDGDEAIAWYAQKIREHGRAPTKGAVTGRGRHLYWAFPESVEIRNMQSVDKQKVDVRGDGGFVVMPPTRHYSGRHYEWRDQAPYQIAPAVPPDWLVELVKHRPPPPPPPRPPLPRAVTEQHLRRAFRDALDTDVAIRQQIGERAGGRLSLSAMKPYMDNLRCPRCGRRDAWFYLSDGPAICHHKKSCNWAGPLTALLEIR